MDNCLRIYDQFMDSVKMITSADISSYNNKEERLNNFYQSLQDEDTFTLFSMSKIKVFSSKTVETHAVSISLFGEDLSLKQIFNNQPDVTKNNLWELLFNLYIQLERINNNDPTRISLLKDGLKKTRSSSSNTVKSDIFKNILNTDVNSTTNNMLDDIISSFQNVVSNKGNPFENIMGITEMITNKYGSKIENGEVEIDKILGGMGGLLNKGMGEEKKEEPVVIDENFSTDSVVVGKEEEAGPQINLTKLMPLANMVTKINSVKSEDDILSLKKDMDNFMEKELKVDMNQYKENMEKLERTLEEAKRNGNLTEDVNQNLD
jgi:hypothetical protein